MRWEKFSQRLSAIIGRLQVSFARWILEQGNTPERSRYLANLELEAALERHMLEKQQNKPRDNQGRYTKRSAAHRA
ncbi:MAG: hypothetical protein ABF628_00865 [Acetobacter orientalis]|uniref:hypothetical protein n=1 Tax=Acetobacter orientalis TaxID=146474 RepID=UPI0039E96086